MPISPSDLFELRRASVVEVRAERASRPTHTHEGEEPA
jgi:hypothetical protein